MNIFSFYSQINHVSRKKKKKEKQKLYRNSYDCNQDYNKYKIIILLKTLYTSPEFLQVTKGTNPNPWLVYYTSDL